MPAYITITARLARPPEMRETNSGTTICNLTLPNDTGWGDNKQTSWWTCTLFGKRAEAAGKHLDKGRWVTAGDLDRLKDLDRFKAITKVSLSAIDSDHFRVFSVYPEGETRKVVDALERTYRDFVRDFAVHPQTRLFHKAKCRVFLIQKALEFERLLTWYGKEMKQDPQRINLILQNRGTYYVYPEPYVLGYQFPDPFEQFVGRTVHKTSHILILAWLYTGRFLPWWITEGLGAAQEIDVLGRCDTFCITTRGYGNEGGPSAEKWQNSEDWKSKLKLAVSMHRDPALSTIKKKGLNKLNHFDLAKAWSVVSWLMEHKRERFIEFLKLLKTGLAQDEALKRAFGMGWGKLDKEWRTYVQNNY